MFKVEPKCSKCEKEIKGDEEVYIQMKYPAEKGSTEIKAYLQNEGQFICEKCMEK
ncbi:Fe3+ hydroxamate ABC transporter substrate-binding protein [Peribacillus sp. NPDC096379]|uniref:Fe3+ hydroxamate ABC transporter substrate-binding protein n=1 Tax=Peribacillus sp. NPDC096379 TaxID=3364393 RepID=UPI0037FC3E36